MSQIPFRWNEKAGRYVDPRTRRFVPASEVRRVLDDALDTAGRAMRKLGEDLYHHRITLAEWQAGMRDALRVRHVYSAAIAHGGWAQMSQADWGRVGAAVKEQLAYLQEFALQIERGEQPLDGRFLLRCDRYGQAGRTTFEQEVAREQEARGFDIARRILGKADHCGDCISAADQGWVPVGQVLMIGDSRCGVACHCRIEYGRDGVDNAQTKHPRP